MASHVADLREEVTFTRQTSEDLRWAVEALEKKQAESDRRLSELGAELDSSRSEVLRLRQEAQAREAALVELLSAQEARIVSTVSDRLQAFGKQTQRAIDKLAQSNQPRQDAAVSQLPSQMGRVHVVSPGETLSAIARMYHVSVSILQRVNDVKDPTRLQVGQDLFIPEPE